MKKATPFFAVFLFLTALSQVSYAYVPEPQTEGKYFASKGTKASEQYESSAGMPTYDYGQGIQWGPLHLKPELQYGYHWTDNVFYSESGEKTDYINSLTGSADVELPFAGGQHLLSGGYRFFQEWFERFGTQDHTDQRGNIGLKLNFVPFTLDADDTYERTVSRADTEFTNRIQRDENAFHSLVEVPFASFFLENEITDFDIQYDRPADQVFNYNLFTVYQRVGYDMAPSTQLLAEYAFINIDYSNSDDRNGDGHQYMLGVRGNFTERIAYQIWGGAQHRIYDEDVRPDFNGFVFRSAIQWEPSELNTIILRGDRRPQESTFDGQSYYARNRAELIWRRQFAERLFFNARGAVTYNEYSRITFSRLTNEDETRRDTLWDGGAGLEYKMANDVVSFLLDYRYGDRTTNLDGLGYEVNEVSASVKASF